MNILAGILKWTQLAMAGVYVAEQTLTADTGASKQQKVIDMVNNEAQVGAAAAPIVGQLAGPIVNLIVGFYNMVGIFQHKSQTPATPAA